MVPAVIRKIHEAKENKVNDVSIWGDGESRREFLDVDDLVDFLVLAMTDIEKLPNVVNVGLGIDNSINEFYQVGATVVGYQGEFSHDLSKPAGMKQKLMDVSISNELGWKAKTPLDDGMRRLYNYYLEEKTNV
jgi:GDP-L-fucose synthase